MTMLISMAVPNRASTASVSISTTSAQSAVLAGGNVVVMATADCFVLRGSNPTATTACLPLVANREYRLTGIAQGERLAFITASGTGTAYITEGA
jgi:hypothetical protein